MKIRGSLLALLLAAGIVCVAGCGRGGAVRYRRDTPRKTSTHTVKTTTSPSTSTAKKTPSSKIKKRSTPPTKKAGSKIKKRSK